MRKLQAIMAGVWALFTISFVMMMIVEFKMFYLLMTLGCCGVSIISFLQYRWSTEQNWRD